MKCGREVRRGRRTGIGVNNRDFEDRERGNEVVPTRPKEQRWYDRN